MSTDFKKLTLKELEREKSLLDRQESEDATKKRKKQRSEIERLLRLHYKRLRSSREPTVPITKGSEFGIDCIEQHSSSFGDGVGDLNLLISDVPIVIPPFSHITQKLAKEIIKRVDGFEPDIGVQKISVGAAELSYFVAHWKLERPISVDELHTISRVVADAYQCDISAYKESGSGWNRVIRPRDVAGKFMRPGMSGVHFGPGNRYHAGANGVMAYRSFKNLDTARYVRSEHPVDFLSVPLDGQKIITHVELRDDGVGNQKNGLAQDNFLMLAVQISYLLAKNKLVEPKALMSLIYRELNRVGTKAIVRKNLYGMHKALEAVERTILLPMQHPEEARKYHIVPESVLLVGVPGVGKTFLEHFLMTGEYNAMFVAVDSDKLRSDLAGSRNTQSSQTLVRADRITQFTGLPVVLIIDDIDVILKTESNNDEIITKFLNLLQGIRQKGLYVLASTNYPEDLDRRLLEPGRLSKIVYVQLPNALERKGVLEIYLKKQPFAQEKTMKDVSDWCTQHTEGWTQRFLWELVVEGARNTMGRSLRDPSATPVLEDYVLAHATILETRNFEEIKTWDERINNFVSSSKVKMGFI